MCVLTYARISSSSTIWRGMHHLDIQAVTLQALFRKSRCWKPHKLGRHIRPDDFNELPLPPQQSLTVLLAKDHNRISAQDICFPHAAMRLVPPLPVEVECTQGWSTILVVRNCVIGLM